MIQLKKAAKISVKPFFALMLLAFIIASVGCLDSKGSLKGAISGKVFDSNGKALEGASVELYGSNNAVKTDKSGYYIMQNLEPGEVKLVATFEEKSVVKIAVVPRGETAENTDITFSVVDALPPVISNVLANNLTENSVSITWQTSEDSDSHVDYATSSLSISNNIMTASNNAMTTEHTVDLNNLAPGVTYYYRARSFDFEKNEGVSSDYQFTTPTGEPPLIPQAFTISPPTVMEKITLNWAENTDSDLKGYNIYRSDSVAGAFKRLNANPVKENSYEDGALKIAQKYYYYVKAIDTAGNESLPTKTLSVVTPGSLSENRVWKAEESPYILQGDLRIQGGAVLTVEPGVEVRFTEKDYMPDSLGSKQTELIVQGSLFSVGTPDKKILYTSAEGFPQMGGWRGIYYLGTTEAENLIHFSTVMFADEGIKSEASAPSIENCEFGFCGVGLNIGLSNSINVKFNTIRDCDIGIVSAGSYIRNNIFTKNQVGLTIMGNDFVEYNTIDCLVGIQIEAGNPVIKNNIIAYTGSVALYGIDQNTPLATPTIAYNDIYGFSTALEGITGTPTANIASDPLFIGGSPYNYELQTIAGGYASDSPCLTAGEANTQMGRYGP